MATGRFVPTCKALAKNVVSSYDANREVRLKGGRPGKPAGLPVIPRTPTLGDTGSINSDEPE